MLEQPFNLSETVVTTYQKRVLFGKTEVVGKLDCAFMQFSQ